jgi:type I restriction enzyme S subunit
MAANKKKTENSAEVIAPLVRLPHGWQWLKLGDVAKKTSIKVLPSDHPNSKFIGMDCIEPQTLKPKFTYKFGDLKSSGNSFEVGQVLYGRMRPYLNKVYKAGFNGACSGEFIVLQCTDNFLPELLQYILHSKSFVRFANSKTSGDRPRISYEEIAEYPIAICSIEEQKLIVSKIEELFSELDKGIEQLKTAQQQLKVYRQAVLKYAFEGRITDNTWEEKELPKGWHWSRLADLALTITDGDHQPPPKASSGIPFITISNVNKLTNRIDFTSTFQVSRDYYHNLQVHRKPQRGDILYTVTGSFGIPVLIDFDKEFCFQRHIGLVRPLPIVSQKWLYYLLQSPKVFNQAKATATGTAQKTVALKSLRNFTVPVCRREEQEIIVREIESRLSVCDKLEETITNSLLQAESLRQSILKKAFEGKLLVKAELENIVALSKPISKATEISIIPESGSKYKSTAKQSPLPKIIDGIKDTDLHAGILAMVIDAHEKAPEHHMKLSHVKGEKIAHLVEAYIGIDLGRNPRKDAAGPDDFPHLKKVESRAAKAGWFGVKKLRVGQTYISKSGMQKIINRVKETLPREDIVKIERLIQTFLPFELEHAEVIATLYAAWNNLLLDGKKPTDEEIVFESRENWSKRKLGIEREAFFKALKWMKEHGFLAEGRGKKVK